MFYRRVNNFVGIESVGYRHIEALYDLGYLPIRIKALPEGSVCPIRVPMMTITNTLPEFFWLTNYLETVFEDGILKKEYSLEEIRQRIDHGL